MGPWHHDHAVDNRAAAQALARHLPVDPTRVSEVGRGWDNVVLEVDGVFLRIAARDISMALLRNEQALLPTLELPLATPRPLAQGEAEPGLPGPWMAYRPVAGTELTQLLARDGQLASPERLARALADLHRPDRVAGCRLPHDPTDRADPSSLGERVRDWTGRAIAAGLTPPVSRLQQLLNETDAGPPALPPSVVHGDLHMRHVLVDETAAPVGLIDFGDACIAPPVGDLSVAWYALLPEQREPFFAAYGALDGNTLAAARRFAAFSCLALQVAADAQGDAGAAAGARTGLARTLA